MDPVSQAFARAHRMLLYLLMALVLLSMVGVSVYYVALVFLLYLWSDNGDIVVPFKQAGRSTLWIVMRSFVDVLPVAAASLLVWALQPEPWISGVILVLTLGFYLISRNRLGEQAKRLSAQEDEDYEAWQAEMMEIGEAQEKD